MSDMTNPPRRRLRLGTIMDHAILIIGVLVMVLPLVMLVQMSSIPDTEIIKRDPDITLTQTRQVAYDVIDMLTCCR